jgi:transcriptional regulator with PAS, ATPase and Fis domain
MESELFGHEKGAFTGAIGRSAGCFEQANGGTLLLDEIAEMPIGTQAKLLRVLEESKVRRLGGASDLPISVRVLAATNRAPDVAIQNKHLALGGTVMARQRTRVEKPGGARGDCGRRR